jgi:hypothetical protein
VIPVETDILAARARMGNARNRVSAKAFSEKPFQEKRFWRGNALLDLGRDTHDSTTHLNASRRIKQDAPNYSPTAKRSFVSIDRQAWVDLHNPPLVSPFVNQFLPCSLSRILFR